MLERSVVALFRDCLRLAKHIGGTSPKGTALKQMVGEGFRRNAGLTDPTKIDAAREDAVRGLSNYLVMKAKVQAKKPRSDATTPR
ncbi:hypothetical protein M885DRAFT_540356 [Pelagophyceae sp. CCMP2097]|nr:hypothetical protein M885DRAFT_540356 [Pelagophyceae sp. CCMP2097]